MGRFVQIRHEQHQTVCELLPPESNVRPTTTAHHITPQFDVTAARQLKHSQK